MDYGSTICDQTPTLSGPYLDDNYTRFVGWSQTMNCGDRCQSDCLQQFYSQNTVNTISKKVTELLMGVDPDNRPIIVPDETIAHVMNQVQNTFRPETGDIYGRYNIPTQSIQDYVQKMIDQTIEIITSDVRNNLGMQECNSKLSIWTTVYGDSNPHGLRQHAPIKILRKRPQTMAFFMNY